MASAPIYRHPGRGPIARIAEWLANHRGLRRIRRRMLAALPFPVLASDVSDVVYLNWLVPAELCAPLVPDGVTVWQQDGRTVLTVLTYRHGHFGPALLGPLRRLMPSPLQSNWRLYVSQVDGTAPRLPTVLFLRNFFSSALYAIGTRVGSDALPSELPASIGHRVAGGLRTTIVDADGRSALEVDGHLAEAPVAPDAFACLAPDWHALVSLLTQQEAAVVAPPDVPELAEARISLPIDVATVRPVRVTRYVPGPWLQRMGATAEPFAFLVPHVHFRVLGERLLADRAFQRAGQACPTNSTVARRAGP